MFKAILNWFFGQNEKDFFPGVIFGDMPSKVHEFDDIVASAASPIFSIKKPEQRRKFPYQYQSLSSSCVSFGTAKLATILYFLKENRFVKFSPGFWYTQRLNKPGEGMLFDDITSLASKGCLVADLLPSEGISEGAMNELKIEQYHRDAADAFAIPKDWIKIDPPNFDTVASVIEKTGKGVKLWFQFGPDEFFNQEYPKMLSGYKPWGHDVTAVDAFTENNKQYILIECSASQEKVYRKLIDRQFFTRCYLAAYPMNFKFQGGGTSKPIYDGTIVSLQKVLRYEGFFPTNIDFVEKIGPATTDAIKKFQAKYGIDPIGTFGPKTKAKVESLYA